MTPKKTLRRISYQRQSSSRFLNHVQVWLRRHLAPTPPPLRTPWVPPLQTCGRLPCVVDSDVSFETYEDTTEVQVKQQKPQPRPCGMIFPDESQRVLIHIFSQDSIHRRANNEPTQQETGLQII
ncbi:uncharacterized protein LOC124369637 [Homalodisca vitripennis]|uniref:uncharacterized protein LOC124369637 n=1 Tax=Homalodisca vitripennis TaxID=197043 RepID=UPI001EE9D5DC|nr:uncharacterized protein LOC124369637 [Homalodisca vitripennis]